MKGVVRLQEAIGAELLRCKLLGASTLQVLERYDVEGFLGRGASGVVVSAHDSRLDRPVALKLSLQPDGDLGLSEARTLATVDHPNVVRVYDVDMTQCIIRDAVWRLQVLVMQRADGVTLRAWLAGEERSVDEILEVFRLAGRGLAAAHHQRIVHRDFKPDNVLVREDGVPQVLDFGFALKASSTRSASEGRRALVAGTDAYMAPEALDGMASARADQYAFAISLAEALTGKIEPPSFWRPRHVPRFVWSALRRATRRRPRRRFDSLTQLLKRLQRPRRWPLALAAAAVAVGGGYAGQSSHVDLTDWAALHAEVNGTLAPRLPPPQVPSPPPVAPPPIAPSEVMSRPHAPAPAEEEAPLGCIPLSAPSRRRVRTTSDRRGRHGCYFFSLLPDEDGCATVAEVVKDGSSSGLDCWHGDARTAPPRAVTRTGEGLVVEASFGGRWYRFVLREGAHRLEGEFRSSLRGEARDEGRLVEPHPRPEGSQSDEQ